MNYQAFTNASSTMMHHGIRGALAADDAFSDLGAECKFRVRETQEWKVHAAALEAEMVILGGSDFMSNSNDRRTIQTAKGRRARLL
jgi:hypothetical protein